MIREIQQKDIQSVLDLIIELAVYENEPEAVINTKEQLSKDLFEDKVCECFVAEIDNEIQGFALFYTSYSTWKGRCLYLEDLYVKEANRKSGLGQQLFTRLIEEAKARKVKRMDWQVLDWNEPAIKFYEKNNALLDPEWINGRFSFE